MKPRLQLFALLVIGVCILAAATFWMSGATALRYRMPKPPSYPFDQIQKVAEMHFPQAIESMRVGYQSFGFTSIDDVQRAELGSPVIEYSLDPTNMPSEFDLKGNLRERLDGGVVVAFPVLVDGTVHAKLLVEYRDGVWQRGGWSSVSSSTWQAILAAAADLEAHGQDPRFALLYFGGGEPTFALYEDQDEPYLVPLSDGGKIFPELEFGGKRSYPMRELLPVLRTHAQRLVADFERNNQIIQSQIVPAPPTPTEVPATKVQPSATSLPYDPTAVPPPGATLTPIPAYPQP
jgi:hypothetical protein